MTSWNPITPFSGFMLSADGSGGSSEPPAADVPDDAGAAEPLPRPARPEPFDPSTEPSFATELSFRAEPAHEPVHETGDDLGWPAPDVQAEDAVEDAPAAHHEPAETEAVPARVPFYKREISFGRKTKTVAPVSDAGTDDEPAADAESFAPERVLETEAEPEHVHDMPPSAEEWTSSEPEEPAPAPFGEAPTDELADDSAASEAAPVAAKKKKEKTRGSIRPARRRSGGNRRHRAKRVTGLKIGASGLTAAVVAENEGRPELVHLARSPLAEGVVVDGEVRDAGALVEALRSFFEEHSLPRRDVRIGLASNRIGVRTFDLVGIDDPARFDNAVRFKAHEVLPIAVTESVLDYRVIRSRVNETGEEIRRVLLVVAPRDQVQGYVSVCRDAGIDLRAIDLEALGLMRAFVEPASETAGTDTASVIVNIGHEGSTLLVSGAGACEFTRVFAWGGATLRDAIANELDTTAAEAEHVLHHLSLAGGGTYLEGLDDDVRAKAVDAVRLRLTPFARELVSSLQFYQTQPESLGIAEIVITGGTSRLDGLADALYQTIGVPVRVGDPLQRIVVARHALDHVDPGAIGSFAVPIGLAVEDEELRSVDLFPREERRSRGRGPRVAAVAVPVALAVPVAAVAFLFLSARGDVTEQEDLLATAQAELSALPQPGGAVVDPGVEQEAAVRAGSLATLLGRRLAWERVLGDVSRVLPADVWLTELRAEVPDLAAGAVPAAAATTDGLSVPTPTGVEIAGYTYSQTDVAQLLARLETLPSLENVQLRQSGVATVAKKDVVQFVIIANLRTSGGAA
jgi:type IV pilus assembly protein PilM